MFTKKKILFLITKANWGGAQKYVFDIVSELKNYEVVVAYGKPCGELVQKLEDLDIKTVEIKTLARDIKILNELRVAINLWRIFKQEHPEIIHLNSSKIGGLGALMGRILGVKKIIFTAHGWAFNENRNWLSRIVIKFLSWLTIILAHQTIVINQKEYHQVIKWPFVTNNKLKLIYNGIKPIYFLNKQEAQKHFTNQIKDSDLVVGTIAELHKNKGLKYAIKAFGKLVKKHKNIKFIIIGEGEERDYLENKIKKYNLENNIFLIGEIKEANQYLKAFDIFVLPSLKEGLPFVLLEAGLAKLPVITTKVGGVPEIIKNNFSGILVERKEDDEIETALEQLITGQEKRQQLGENLNTVIKEKFSFDKMFEMTKKIYQ